MFITDWFATLMNVAGLKNSIPTGLDSFNMWPSIIDENKESPRQEIILNLDMDPLYNVWSAALM